MVNCHISSSASRRPMHILTPYPNGITVYGLLKKLGEHFFI